MSTDFLYGQSEILILLALFGMLLLACEAGFQLGRRNKPPEQVRAHISNIEGALLGLFALLLGFTFAMALSRFELRRQMVVQEANAIGTAALRARLLPADERAEVTEMFRRYVAIRLAAASGPNLPSPEHRELDAEAGRLQEQLWLKASAAAEADTRSVPAGLLLQAMNQLIDIKGERDASLANRVPESVLMLLFGFAVLTSGVLGFANGLAGARTMGTVAILSVLICLVMLVIIDLDRPRRGLIRVSQDSMIAVQKTLDAQK
ncbi:MAG: hypothetical protein ACREAA_02505 [Candidatus Polarisedimenticolia bacterium]